MNKEIALELIGTCILAKRLLREVQVYTNYMCGSQFTDSPCDKDITSTLEKMKELNVLYKWVED